MKTYLFGLIALIMAFTSTNAISASKLWKKELVSIHCEYDLSDSGAGTVGTHAVCNLPDNFVVTEAIVNVDTALTGGGTLVVGEDGGGDADGYWTDLDAVTGVLKCSGALCASSAAHQVAAAKDGVLITIATTAYTAGVLKFAFIGYQGE
jgi:hypothetical protein